ncbi:histidine kinase [Alsobacter soli]|uniref:histidine kinase n=1 Tax=Alsobacter soli TaxID=2109933 RepID=A0A2T1HU66_9HYPH|nr:histidine kinase dimerization/phosphoacceptor domain -containing protein [Alsobacter soli]PSC05168.1 histidine kinase [Alsobacter soli]
MDSGHRFQELADHAPVLIWRVGPDMACNYVNVPRLEFTGRPLGEELGEGWYDVIHPEDVDRCRRHFRSAFDLRREFKMDYRLRRHDGVYRWVLDTGRAFFDAQGRFAGYLGSCVDITDRKEAEVRAAQALAEARRALRQRDVLLAEVHHRVKNNLQVILSLIALKARDVQDDDCREALESVGRRVQAIGVIQQELHEDDDVSSIGLLDYINRLLPPLMMIHHGDRAALTVNGENAPIDLATATLMGMILAELTANAFNHAFAAGAGAISVEIGRNQLGRLQITMQDSGPGFGDEARPHGIGLKLVRNLARQGRIEIECERGAGARWTLVLPSERSWASA